MIAFYWDRMDQWFEEDEEVFVHPRDPYHRVDVIPTSRHIKISLDGEVLAESTRRWRCSSRTCRRAGTCRARTCPPSSSRPTPSRAARTRAPPATTRSGVENGDTVKDLIWYYDDPLRAVDRIAGRLCFFNERCDVEVDGELEGRPETTWKHGVKSERSAAPDGGALADSAARQAARQLSLAARWLGILGCSLRP